MKKFTSSLVIAAALSALPAGAVASASPAIPGLPGSLVLPGAPGPKKPVPPKKTLGDRVAEAAKSKLGSPYVYGAAGPNAFDCSGLVQWSYKKAGKTIPRDSYGQLGGGRPVSLRNAKPGDVLIFNGGGHAAVYVGDGRYVHASTEGQPVKYGQVATSGPVSVRRY